MTTLSFAVTAFDPLTAPPEQRLAVGQLIATCLSFTYPDDPPVIPEKEAISLTHLGPDEQARQFVVWDGVQAIGWGKIVYDLKQNTHAAFTRLFVHPQRRRHGLGRAIARELESVARQEGRHTITFGTSSKSPAGEAFAQAMNATPALPMRQSRVNLHGISPELLEIWQARPADDPYQLHQWTTIPDEYLTRVADLMMVMNTAPKGDLDMEDWLISPEMIRSWEGMIAEAGETRYFLAAENTRTRQLDGYTETFWDAERAAIIYQGATAVRPSARGQRLGKWLKAAMTRHLQTHCPGAHWIRTNNAHSNEAMLAINEAMGFEPWATFTEWQLKLN